MTDLVRRVTQQITQQKTAKKLPEIATGDTVGVYVRLKEGEKERVQLYRGVVMKVQGSGIGRSFTVRKISAGVGVERTFPLASPAIDRVEVISRGKVRRSRLFYLRGLKGRSARLDTATVSDDSAAAAGVGAADEVQGNEETAKVETAPAAKKE